MQLDYNIVVEERDWKRYKELPLYQAFEFWFTENSGYCCGGESLLRWDVPEQQFFVYNINKGYFEPLPVEYIIQMISAFADMHSDEKVDNGDYTLIVKRFKSHPSILFNDEWNAPGFENLRDCVINLTTLERLDHDVKYMFRYAIPRTLQEIDPYTLAIFQNLIQTGSKPDRLLQHFINIVHRDFSQKIFVMIYGKAGGGKSTLLNIPANLYGDDLTSATDIYRMGRKFGLEDCYDKRINVDSDMPTKKMSPDIVATLKKITGGVHGSDNKMVVEKKGVGIFSVHIHCFFLFGCNQLAKWEEDSLQEVESIMRRALLVKYESFAIDCAGLEEITLDPEFLDKIYTWLLHQPVAPVKNIDKASWVKETQKEWFLDCDPLMGVLNDLYESSDSDKDTVPCREVYDKALAELQDQNLTIPKNLMAQITISLMAMGVRKNTTKNNPKYLRIKRQYILDGSEDDPKNPYEEMGVIPNRGGSA